ncbi:hypothetical protein V5N11_012411 [Cardamine amara subsp. amara]|uniref:Uncharacterized protein n=1 Tax=Cardamine amara subsp. amara TaxID=228776 RepID=A0ABD0ZDH4_CARAN
MEKGKAVMGTGRRWAVDFSDQFTVYFSRDILDPPVSLVLLPNRLIQETTIKRKTLKLIGKHQKAWEVEQSPFKKLMMMDGWKYTASFLEYCRVEFEFSVESAIYFSVVYVWFWSCFLLN